MHVRHLGEVSRDLELGVKVIQISEYVEQVVVDKTLRRHNMMREETQRRNLGHAKLFKKAREGRPCKSAF